MDMHELLELYLPSGKITRFNAVRPALVQTMWEYVRPEVHRFPANLWSQLTKDLDVHSVQYSDYSGRAELMVSGLPKTRGEPAENQARFRIVKVQVGDQVLASPPEPTNHRCRATTVGVRF